MKGKLKNGFEYEVNDSIFDDWEFIKLYKKTQDDAFASVDLVMKLLGEEQEAKLCDALRGKDGIVHTEDIAAAINEIANMLQESGTAGKN